MMWVWPRQHERPAARPESLRIYEAHVGMSSEERCVASYTYFKGRHPSPAWQHFSAGPTVVVCKLGALSQGMQAAFRCAEG